MTDSELKRRFVSAHDELLPPTPALESRIAEALIQEQRLAREFRSPLRAGAGSSGAGRSSHPPLQAWQSNRAPRMMGLVAAMLAIAIVASLVLAARGLHLGSPVPGNPIHPFVRVWSRTINDHATQPGTLHDLFPSLGVTSDGYLFLQEPSSHDIIKLSASDGHEVLRWTTIGDGPGQFAHGPNRFAVDAANNLYATEWFDDKVVEWDENGTYLREWSTEQPTGPSGIGVDGAGRIYVGLFGRHDHYIQVFAPGGQLVTAFGRTGTGDGEFQLDQANSGVSNLVVEPDGSVWVTDVSRGRLYHFAGDGSLLLQAGGGAGQSPGTRFMDVYPGPGGHVYVDGGGAIHEFDASGRDLGIFGADVVGLPHHEGYYNVPVADSSGNLYVFDIYASTLIKFSRQRP